MKFIHIALILLMTAMSLNATRASRSRGEKATQFMAKDAKSQCKFKIRENSESKRPNGTLVLHTTLAVLNVRDVPDSGGTYGVDIK